MELLAEDDYSELPEEDSHKFLHLEKIARSRLMSALDSGATSEEYDTLRLHYMHVVVSLAESFGVKGIQISSEVSTERSYDKFLLAITRAQTLIWSKSTATFPFGRVALAGDVKTAIIALTAEIEIQIDGLQDNGKRKARLHKLLGEFRHEINQPKTRIGSALSSLAQISTVVAMSTTTLAQGPDAYSTIQRILGAEQLSVSSPEIQLLEHERPKLRLAPPPKRLPAPKDEERE